MQRIQKKVDCICLRTTLKINYSEKEYGCQSRSPNTKLLAAMAEIVAQSPNKEDTTAAVSPVRASLDNALEATEVEQVEFEELVNKLLAQLDERNTTIANMQRKQENLVKQVQEAQADIDMLLYL